jgi:hypothetical protein
MEGKIFKNNNEFALYIENLVIEKRMTHMDAVLLYCEQNFIDPEDISKLINKNLKQKIEMNMIAEGYYAVRSIYSISRQHNIHLPIIEAVYHIVYEKANPQAEMNKLKGGFGLVWPPLFFTRQGQDHF